jgi:membrane protein DedA with SNARE-associated domain
MAHERCRGSRRTARSPVLAGFCLTLVYFAVGFGAYLVGQPDRERLHEAGRTLVQLSPVPSVLGLVLAGLAAASGFGFLLGSVAAVPLALCVPVLSVASALDEHAVE